MLKVNKPRKDMIIMKASIKELEYNARLSMLILNDHEKELFLKNLNDFLGYAEKLDELDLENVEPVTHVIQIFNAVREDEIQPSMSRNRILMNSPEIQDGYFRVPKTID
jgi:aspartyl-tRNA(Asn)/glutamyl-tRNA(Gln) amidotransferase subunit C